MAEKGKSKGLKGEHAGDAPEREEKGRNRTTRREFVKGTAVGAAGVAAAGVLAGCAPAATPEVIKETVEVPVEVTREVIKEVEVTREVEVIKEVEVNPWLPEKWDYEADVVVVGAGLAGLSAAIEAADAGASVILLEKMPSVTDSHSTRCVGNIAGAGSRLQAEAGYNETPDQFYEDLLAQGASNHRLMPAELLRVLADNAGKNIDWLEELGVPFDYVCWRPPDSTPRAHIVVMDEQTGGPLAFGTVLAEKAKEKGVEILLDTGSKELYRWADGEIAGVRAESKEGTSIAFKAKRAVILSSGDYAASEAIKAKYTSDFEDAAAPCGGNPGNTGDGFIMAWAVGADSICLDSIGSPSGIYMLPQQPRGTGISNYIIEAGAIVVNKDGKRFDNEFSVIVSKSTYEQPDQVAFVVFDSIAASTDVVPEGAPTGRGPWICTAKYLDHWRNIPGAVKEADTIEELAEELGVSSSGLRETVDTYNGYVDAGKDPDFGRTPLGPGVKEPPFIGLGPGKPMMILSNGTLMVNDKLQVLNVFGKIIPRLYAVGDVGKSGMIVGHGTHMAWACASGRRSGQFAAEETPRA